MGVGKSSIGEDLSKKLNMNFGDIDLVIEKKLSLSIAEIFKKKGEEYFRKVEEKETIDFINKKNFVIALGGGAFINKHIRDASSKNCVSFWLDLNTKTIFQRIKINMKRPLLNYNTTEQEIGKLYEDRKKIYSLSDFKIDCNSKKKDQVVKEILNIYENI